MSTSQGLLDIDFSLISCVGDNSVGYMAVTEDRDLKALSRS